MRLSHADTAEKFDSKPRETRAETRYDQVAACECHAVNGLGQVDAQPLFVGLIQDVSQNGMGIRADSPPPAWLDSMLVCVDVELSTRRFCSVVVERSDLAGEQFVWGCAVGGPLAPIFQSGVWFPKLAADLMTYEMPFDPSVWLSLEAVGAMRRESLDYVSVCGDCGCLVNVRWGCPHCLSAHLTPSRMIHHYACAHVDLTSQFAVGGSVICPKCQARNLIVGADFEYLDGPKACVDCGQASLEPQPIAHCMGCGRRRRLEETEDLEIVSHHVRRFEPMELVSQH